MCIGDSVWNPREPPSGGQHARAKKRCRAWGRLRLGICPYQPQLYLSLHFSPFRGSGRAVSCFCKSTYGKVLYFSFWVSNGNWSRDDFRIGLPGWCWLIYATGFASEPGPKVGRHPSQQSANSKIYVLVSQYKSYTQRLPSRPRASREPRCHRGPKSSASYDRFVSVASGIWGWVGRAGSRSQSMLDKSSHTAFPNAEQQSYQ